MYNVLKSRNRQDALYNIFVFMLYIIIMTLILRFLWNTSLVKHISILKPVDSLYHTFLLALAISVFKC
jgi:hypothetical protein